MNYCVHCHMVIFALSYDQLSSSSFHRTTIKFVKHHPKSSVYAAFSTIQAAVQFIQACGLTEFVYRADRERSISKLLREVIAGVKLALMGESTHA